MVPRETWVLFFLESRCYLAQLRLKILKILEILEILGKTSLSISLLASN